MTDPKATPATTPSAAATATAPKPAKYKVGDTVVIPCHSGTYTATVMKVYKDLKEAVELHGKSFSTILQSPHGKGDESQPYYFCQVANPNMVPPKPLGVAEQHATLKRRAGQ